MTTIVSVIDVIMGDTHVYGLPLDTDPICQHCLSSHRHDGLVVLSGDTYPVGVSCLSIAQQFICGSEAARIRQEYYKLTPEVFSRVPQLSSVALAHVEKLSVKKGLLTDEEDAWLLLVATGLCGDPHLYLLTSLEAAAKGGENLSAANPLPSRGPDRIRGAWMGVLNTTCDLEGLECKEIKQLETHEKYGERFLIKFEGPEGQEVVWFTGASTKFDPKPGEIYNVRAGIKDHSIYTPKGSNTGTRQTTLTRCKEIEREL